jgi:tRNA threonylcarbamoyladenosine biosynthesis protein TsaE
MSIFEELSKGIVSGSSESTIALAKRLGEAFPADHVLALQGDLGAGKTTFAKGFASAYEIDPKVVKSPSFNIYHIHEGTAKIVHMDLYRLKSDAEMNDLMIEEWLMSPWVVLVEWPERGLAEWMHPVLWKLEFSEISEGSIKIQLTEQP